MHFSISILLHKNILLIDKMYLLNSLVFSAVVRDEDILPMGFLIRTLSRFCFQTLRSFTFNTDFSVDISKRWLTVYILKLR